MSGKLFLFEGGEGSGKTTLVRAVADILKNDGVEVVTTREPGGTEFAEEVRELLIKKRANETEYPSPRAQLLGFYSARFDHIEKVILPALKEGKVVLCDRFEISSFVYQVHAQDPELMELFQMLHKEVCGLLRVYTTRYIVCDIDPKIGVARARARDDKNTRFDDADLAFHQSVREGMQAAKKHIDICFEFVHVDASQSKEALLEEVVTIVRS